MEKKQVYYFELPGEPIAQQRHRQVIAHGHRVIFNPNKVDKESAQRSIKVLMLKSSWSHFKGPISVQMTFGVSIPDSYSKKRREGLLNAFCDKRPDLDNYIKFYMDVLNGVVFADDGQVTKLECKKIYSDQPKTIIYVTQLVN